MYAIVGAGWALTISFAVLAFSWRTSRFRGAEAGRPLPVPVARVVDSPGTRWAIRLLGLVVTAYVGWAALLGEDVRTNPTLGVFYVYLWVGLVPVSLLLGNVWPLLSPMRTLHLLFARAVRLDPDRGLVPYPSRLGNWPAAVGLFAFVWTELVDPDSAFVSTVVTWCLLYAAVMLVGGAVFGTAWFERADPFEVFFGLVARLSPWGRGVGPDGRTRLVVRNPLDGLDTTPPRPGLVAVVAVLLGSTAFDSFAASEFWFSRVSQSGGGLDPVLRDTLVLLGFCLVVAVTFSAAAVAARGLGPRWRTMPAQLAHSLVPIVVGYVFAHYLTLLVEYGQTVLIHLTDPLQRGDDYLGTADLVESFWLTTHPTLLAVVKVSFIVVGHVLGVVAAHDRAVRLLPEEHAVGGQLAMLVTMVGYTTAGLLLLFSA